jgi:hypothetical protein
MASTRNKNSVGDYTREQIEFQKRNLYDSYYNYGINKDTQFPGDGFLTGRIYSGILSTNNEDIESFLFGIGSTNLETPKAEVVPEIKGFKTNNLITRLPIVLPSPVIIDANQRPYPLK